MSTRGTGVRLIALAIAVCASACGQTERYPDAELPEYYVRAVVDGSRRLCTVEATATTAGLDPNHIAPAARCQGEQRGISLSLIVENKAGVWDGWLGSSGMKPYMWTSDAGGSARITVLAPAPSVGDVFEGTFEGAVGYLRSSVHGGGVERVVPVTEGSFRVPRVN